MIKLNLTMALDFAKKKKNPPPNECESFRKGDQWYVVSRGNGYSNTFKVTEFDDEGLKRLEKMETKETTNETSTEPRSREVSEPQAQPGHPEPQ